MDDGETFTLSFAEVDLLSEAMGLDCRAYPFTIPSVGATLEERVELAKTMFDGLRARRLAQRDRLNVEVADALRLLAGAKVSIAVSGIQNGELLLARVCGHGRHAVVVLQDGDALRFEQIRPTSLAMSAVRLLPRMGPGPGQSVTLAERSQVRDALDWEPGGFVEPNRAARTGDAAQLVVAQGILQRPRDATGSFTVTGRGRMNRPIEAGEVSWFDTDVGRYLSRRKRGLDGVYYITWSPADRSRLEQVIGELVDEVLD
ncbi:ESX secretion-associated protein EspG [Labedaea rhizosphaerae]|uniref:ESAT-6 protein secretion system EspG family protein n=1 Tax=Labedaea rhizosphaerae TaxID=598644 RepID=A0A4V3D0D6_LABRH|nr:ESX secretion-associated protein EspG [Labedaea rhizosphaerae]TDQ05445.1 ESAT-6 protein secretion system EspG family protein [Labedaea rhizosphaerae]